MVYEIAVDFINTVGFPIAAFLLMYRMANDTIRENTEALQELSKKVEDLD